MEKYTVIERIGCGSFGQVTKISRKEDNKTLVWKELHYGSMSNKEKELIVSEVNILRELRHPHVVRYYDRIIDRELRNIYIVMEYCDGGDMAQTIKNRKAHKRHEERVEHQQRTRLGRHDNTNIVRGMTAAHGTQQHVLPSWAFDEEILWDYFFQLCLALRECHQRKEGKILHRDIKPANIFISHAQNCVKLGDFGLARVLSDKSRFAHTNVGTPFYMAPEQANGSHYDEKCDVWSLGCCLYEMCQLEPPFKADNQMTLLKCIMGGTYKDIMPQYSPQLRYLVKCCLTVNLEERPSVDQLLVSHPPLCLRLRERKLNSASYLHKKKEHELHSKCEDLRRKEEELEEWENNLMDRETEMRKREQQLAAREQILKEFLGLHENIPYSENNGEITSEPEYVLKTTHEHSTHYIPLRENLGTQLENDVPIVTSEEEEEDDHISTLNRELLVTPTKSRQLDNSAEYCSSGQSEAGLTPSPKSPPSPSEYFFKHLHTANRPILSPNHTNNTTSELHRKFRLA